jgi:hypothetical protein
MMAMERAPMNDEPPRIGGRIGRIALIAVATLVAIFGAGVIAGIIAAHLQRGGGTPSATLIMLLVGAGLLTAGAAFLAVRQVGAIAKEDGAATPRERRNRTVLIACGAVGGVMGAMLTLVGPTPFSAFTGDPLPPWVAVSFAAIVALLVPAVSLYWHRHVVDEQEAAAYSKGALLGLYVFWIGAPTWWFLWRGGLAPAPDGVLIYFATIAVAGIVWMWAKYR